MSERRRFCENCGAEVSEATNFCPSCGAAQRPDPQVPGGPPPQAPQPGSITTPAADVPPPPQDAPRGAAATAWRGTRLGCGILAILVLLLIIRNLLGGGEEETADSPAEQGERDRGAEEQREAAPEPEPEREPAPEPEPEDPNPHFGDGTHRVGEDIPPGMYRTREGSPGCYYARLAGFGADLDDILANNNTDAPAIVTIEPTDVGFESRDCGTWTQDLSAITQSKTSFGDGAYIVGTDIEPGTYRSSGSSGCYYQRLSGFNNDLDSIIANANTDTPAVVTIEPTDKGFETKQCGEWTRIE